MAPADSVCPRCGEHFGCGVAQARCWCHELTLSAEALADLRARYDTCLCPACLREWAAAPATPAGLAEALRPSTDQAG